MYLHTNYLQVNFDDVARELRIRIHAKALIREPRSFERNGSNHDPTQEFREGSNQKARGDYFRTVHHFEIRLQRALPSDSAITNEGTGLEDGNILKEAKEDDP